MNQHLSVTMRAQGKNYPYIRVSEMTIENYAAFLLPQLVLSSTLILRLKEMQYNFSTPIENFYQYIWLEEWETACVYEIR